jgi:hypothetical protein
VGACVTRQSRKHSLSTLVIYDSVRAGGEPVLESACGGKASPFTVWDMPYGTLCQ